MFLGLHLNDVQGFYSQEKWPFQLFHRKNVWQGCTTNENYQWKEQNVLEKHQFAGVIKSCDKSGDRVLKYNKRYLIFSIELIKTFFSWTYLYLFLLSYYLFNVKSFSFYCPVSFVKPRNHERVVSLFNLNPNFGIWTPCIWIKLKFSSKQCIFF